MRSEDLKFIPLWILLVVAPIGVCAFGLSFIPEGTTQIPLHWDFQGNVNGWGDPGQLMVLGYIMSATNLLLAVSYFATDWLNDHGLVHGVSLATARRLDFIMGFMMVILTGAIQMLIIRAVLGAL